MEIKPIRVGLLNDYIGDVLSRDGILSNVRVIWEIANLTEHSTGHSYFSLKDEDSTIKCFFSKFSKVLPYIWVIFSGIDIFSKLLQLENADEPIYLTVSGIDIL